MVNFTIILLACKICIRLFWSCYVMLLCIRAIACYVSRSVRVMRISWHVQYFQNIVCLWICIAHWNGVDFGRSSQRNFRGELASYGDLESQHARSQFTTSRITSQPTRSHHNHTTSHHITPHPTTYNHITSSHVATNHIASQQTHHVTTTNTPRKHNQPPPKRHHQTERLKAFPHKKLGSGSPPRYVMGKPCAHWIGKFFLWPMFIPLTDFTFT